MTKLSKDQLAQVSKAVPAKLKISQRLTRFPNHVWDRVEEMVSEYGLSIPKREFTFKKFLNESLDHERFVRELPEDKFIHLLAIALIRAGIHFTLVENEEGELVNTIVFEKDIRPIFEAYIDILDAPEMEHYLESKVTSL